MINLEEKVREQIVAALPELLKKALADYKEFIEKKEGTTAKDFKARHEACKAAVAHIALILKLAQQAGLPAAAGDAAQQDVIRALIAEAEDELSRHAEE